MRNIQKIKSSLESIIGDFAPAKEKFQIDFNQNPFYALEWQSGRIIRAQVMLEEAQRVLAVINRTPDFDANDLAKIIKDLNNSILIQIRGASKSTCAFTNAIADEKQAALASFLEQLKTWHER